jgi:hypothetical protein
MMDAGSHVTGIQHPTSDIYPMLYCRHEHLRPLDTRANLFAD